MQNTNNGKDEHPLGVLLAAVFLLDNHPSDRQQGERPYNLL